MGNTKVRESNIELLRNISMFMILVIHANFVSLPMIGYEELMLNTVPSVTRFFIESLGIVAVNVFVFISGWFGIRTRVRSVFSFIYLVLFYLLGGGLLFILLGKAEFSMSWILDVFQLSGNDWFIKSYLVLMIIAPVLNAFSENTEERTQRYVVISFFLFETIYGWAAGGSRFFVSGYGPLHFIGIYLIARYIHGQCGAPTIPCIIKKIITLPKWVDFCIFIITAILNTSFVIMGAYFTHRVDVFHALAYSYSNPLVIVGALYMFLFFSKMDIPYCKVINLFGASSFAVYLLHGEHTVRSLFFTPLIQYLYSHYYGVTCIFVIFTCLCIVYFVSVIIDQLRILSWNWIWRKFNGIITG